MCLNYTDRMCVFARLSPGLDRTVCSGSKQERKRGRGHRSCVCGTYGRIVLFVLRVYVSSSAAGGDAINAHRASWGLPVPEPQARRSGRRGGTGPCSDSHVAGLLLPGLGPWQGWLRRDGTESLWLHQPSSPAGQWNRQPPWAYPTLAGLHEDACAHAHR